MSDKFCPVVGIAYAATFAFLRACLSPYQHVLPSTLRSLMRSFRFTMHRLLRMFIVGVTFTRESLLS